MVKMETDTNIQEKIERWKILADVFIKENTKAFVKDIYDNWYFCYIIFNGVDSVHVQHFKGKKKFEKERIYWANITKFTKYIPEEREGVEE